MPTEERRAPNHQTVQYWAALDAGAPSLAQTIRDACLRLLVLLTPT